MKAVYSTLLGALLLGAPRTTRAAEAVRAAARLELVRGAGTEQCMTQPALARAVEARLQRPVFRKDRPATLALQVSFAHTETGWAAELTLLDAGGVFLGSRSIVTAASHCSALDDSLALVVALLVDSPPSPPVVYPTKPTDTPAAAPANAAAEPAVGQPPSAGRAAVLGQIGAPIRLPRDTPARREPWRVLLSGAASALLGTLPGVAWGGELGVAGKPPTLPELRVFAGLYATREQQRSTSSSGARFSFANVGLEVCPVESALGALRWFGCAGQSLGWLRSASFGFDENTTRTHLSYALLAHLGLDLRIAGPLGARLSARAELPLARGIFTYGAKDGSERSLFETQPVTAVLDLGMIVRL